MTAILPVFHESPLVQASDASSTDSDHVALVDETSAAAESPARVLQQGLARSLARGQDRRWSPRATLFFFVAVNGAAWILVASGVKLFLLR